METLHPPPSEEDIATGEQYSDIGIVDIPVPGLRPDLEDLEGNILTPGNLNSAEVQNSIVNDSRISSILDFIEEKGLNSSWKQRVSALTIAVGIGTIALGIEHKRGWRDIQELYEIFKKDKENQTS